MEVLSSRILVQPSDFERSRRWYTDVLGLRVYREFGAAGRTTGVVLFCGGGFIELSGGGSPAGPGITLWLQVPSIDVEHTRLAETGEVSVTAPPATMPWGLREMRIADPDGIELVLVEVPDGHPLRTRLSVEK